MPRAHCAAGWPSSASRYSCRYGGSSTRSGYWISGGCASGDNIDAAVRSATVNASPTRYSRPCRSCSIRSSAAATVARSVSSLESPINAQSPLRRRMAQQRVAILLQVWRQLDAQRVLDLRWLRQRRQHRRRGQVGDRERITDEVFPALPLLLDPL